MDFKNDIIILKDTHIPSWDSIFMEMAVVFSRKSKDPNTQVGAIVTLDNRIKACGYNGFPPKCEDKEDNMFNWDRENKDPLKTKYPFVSHAERNALDFVDCSVEGGTIYTTLFPCHECATTIINKGIKRVVYLEDTYKDTWQIIASKEKLNEAGVKYEFHSIRMAICISNDKLDSDMVEKIKDFINKRN